MSVGWRSGALSVGCNACDGLLFWYIGLVQHVSVVVGTGRYIGGSGSQTRPPLGRRGWEKGASETGGSRAAGASLCETPGSLAGNVGSAGNWLRCGGDEGGASIRSALNVSGLEAT